MSNHVSSDEDYSDSEIAESIVSDANDRNMVRRKTGAEKPATIKKIRRVQA